MPLPDAYLEYPHRRHAMDHGRYDWSDLFQRPAIRWPGDARIALWVTPMLQWFPLDMSAKPFRAPGGLTMTYPDYRHYTNRDYGNRVGIYRILDLLDSLKVPASVAVNGAIAQRYPLLLQELVDRRMEIVAHGLDMGQVHHSGLTEAAERAIITRALSSLREASGQPVTGWISPGRAQSHRTPDLLTEQGVTWCGDWANDDLPYAMRTSHGPLHAMPLAQETDDRTVMLECHHTEDDWLQQVKDRFDVLYRESAGSGTGQGGRIVSLPLHAWVSGVPYRIGRVRAALEYMLGHDGVWPATAGEILAAYQAAVA